MSTPNAVVNPRTLAAAMVLVGVATGAAAVGGDAPLNDWFVERVALTGTEISLAATCIEATREPGEPAHAGRPGSTSVWWTWTAPHTGRVVIAVTPTGGFQPVIGVYQGSELEHLVPVASGSAFGLGPAYATFDAVADTPYSFAVDTRAGSAGNFTLDLRSVLVPPNDLLAQALVVTSSPPPEGYPTNPVNADFFVTASNLGATLEPGETGGAASVWWRWTAPTNGEVLIELDSFGSEPTLTYPLLVVYRGTALEDLVAVNPCAQCRWAGQHYADARYDVTTGTPYLIRVASSEGAVQGTYALRGRFEGTPPNDRFSNPLIIDNSGRLLQQGNVYLLGWNSVATREPGEPYHGGNALYAGTKSVWWRWTAPFSGRANVGVTPVGYAFSAMLGVYTGSAVDQLSRVAYCRSLNPNGSCSTTFSFMTGATYHLAVAGGGTYGDSGEYRLGLSLSIDTNAPAVTITSPVEGQPLEGPEIVVAGRATDPAGAGPLAYSSGVQSVEVRLNGGPWRPAAGTDAWTCPLTLEPGANLIEARARDHVGNESLPASARVFLGLVMVGVVTDHGFTVTFPTEAGQVYHLEFTASLAVPAQWLPVSGASVNGTGTALALTDPQAGRTTQRFYRLRAQPQTRR